MVDDSILKTLQPGDVIEIASSEDLQGLDYEDASGLTKGMISYADRCLTVRKVWMRSDFVRVYVEENNCWWRGTFIKSFYYAETPVPCEEAELTNLLWEG